MRAPRKTTETPAVPISGDWERFENMFLTQDNAKSISDEEKFGYLLKSVGPKARDQIANLKPGSVGYKRPHYKLTKFHGKLAVARLFGF